MSEFCKNSSLGARDQLSIGGKEYTVYNINKACEEVKVDSTQLPYTLKILLENLLRHEGNGFITKAEIMKLFKWLEKASNPVGISYQPARVLMQDFTGVPAVVDLAAMRDACDALGVPPSHINPKIPVDLIIDHSVQVDSFAKADSFKINVSKEFERNHERYKFLKWGQKAFDNFSVVPPGNGICHQVNIEYLAKIVWQAEQNSETFLYPDTLVGTDSHTTMVNALAVLGWGVGGIEAEAAMLGQPISMLIPDVVGFKMHGKLKEGVTATDLVLHITQILRGHNVVGKFVEFVGDGLESLSLADRATISNMAPEYGATCGFFPVDDETLRYMSLTGRTDQQIEVIEQYTKMQGIWRDESYSAKYTTSIDLDLSEVGASLAGPSRPQDRVDLSALHQNFKENFDSLNIGKTTLDDEAIVEGKDYKIKNGDVVISAITSCTNTSNPNALIAAGLIAKKADELGLKAKPHVKTSFAPGSRAVTKYMEDAALQQYLDNLGYNVVGYGCTTCIGNSGPLQAEIEDAIIDNDLVVSSVLSGNRNFEGRIHPFVRANYLASPALCIIYALAGTVNFDIASDPICQDKDGNDIYLKDLWPDDRKVNEYVANYVKTETFTEKYQDIFHGGDDWNKLSVNTSEKYEWDSESTYINRPTFFDKTTEKIEDIQNARLIGVFGDSITTDHISPAGRILENRITGKYLSSKGVKFEDFNSYGSRRGNHEVMVRGTFANVRVKNLLLKDGKEGGYAPNSKGETVFMYEAAEEYIAQNVPLLIFAGKEYGTGSSRDWAAKGTKLLGVRAVIAESFERIHRSNLVGMGVLPICMPEGVTTASLNLEGKEVINILNLGDLKPKQTVQIEINYPDGKSRVLDALARVDTEFEIEYLKNGGILNYVLKQMAG